MPNDAPTLFGPNNQPISNHIAYPLGPSVLTLAGDPMQLFQEGFHATDPKTGQAAGNLSKMLQATWAAASASAIEQATHAHQLECRLGAMERMLKRHRPDLHEEYLKEVVVVRDEMMAAAQAQFGQQPAPDEGPA